MGKVTCFSFTANFRLKEQILLSRIILLEFAKLILDDFLRTSQIISLTISHQLNDTSAEYFLSYIFNGISVDFFLIFPSPFSYECRKLSRSRSVVCVCVCFEVGGVCGWVLMGRSLYVRVRARACACEGNGELLVIVLTVLNCCKKRISLNLLACLLCLFVCLFFIYVNISLLVLLLLFLVLF